MSQFSTRPLTPPPDPSVKVTHLVFGLLFLGAAGIWALVAGGVITADRLTVLAPALLIAAGVVGLAASLASSRNRRRSLEDAAVASRDEQDDLDAREDTDPTEELR